MRFDVLGPMRVTDGRGPRPVAGARQRILLGALLAHANQPMPADQLAEIVWDGAPPERAMPTLRTYMTRLRQDLGPDAASRILTRDRGYLAAVGPGELDALDFEALCRDAGTAVRAADWAAASDYAAGALALWRGNPLGDVPSQALRDSWLPRLDQQRVQVTEWRIEAGLHLGRHEQLVPQLRQLTAEHPLRERFHVQLMQALARCGRQAEALAAYQDARKVLVGEVGIEPGPELRNLQKRILAGDGGSAATPPSAGPAPVSTPAVAVPRQLPAAAGHFTGRHGEIDLITGLHELSQQADVPGGTVVISAIDGMAGIGKTALAVHAAHRLAGRFPSGQLFIDLHGYTEGHPPREPGEALATLLRSLGVPAAQIPDQPEECAALYRQRLADTRTLIVLDNALNEAQVRPLLPGTPGCLVLVTSRRRLRGLHDAHVVALDVLPEVDALMLLRMVIAPAHALVGDADLAEIAGLCGRLPLALRIAGALLRHRPAWTPGYLAGLLRDEHRRLATLADGDHDLHTVFDLSYRGLGERQQLLFRRLALVPGPEFDAFAAAALLDTDPAAAARLLEDLVDHNLLTEHAPGRYQLHDLIRTHARALADADPAPARDAALNRLLDYYQHTAGHADTLISRHPWPGPAGPAPAHAPALPGPDAARAWLRAERPSLLAALQHAAAQARHERSVALTAGIATLLLHDGPWSQALTLHAAAAAAARRIGDRSGQATALIQLGVIREMNSDYPGAIEELQQGLRLFEDLDDRLGQANALVQLAETRQLTGDGANVTRDLEQALRLYESQGNKLGQANALERLGELRRYTGDYAGRIECLEQALQLYRGLNILNGQANVLNSLGVARRDTGDFIGAALNLQQALELSKRQGNRLGQANTLSRLGDLRRETGDHLAAARDLEQALQLYKDLGHRLGQANAMIALGDVRLCTGNPSDAAALMREGIGIFRRIGSRAAETWALNRYAAVISATDDYARAGDVYRDALRLAQETHMLDEEALALEGLGECHLPTGQTETGAALLKQALEIYERLGMTPDIERVRARLTDLPPAR
jgi:DNA-binding SARP family transcriptional activator/tetratricopeptide (TPR) repeat protein